MDIERGLTMLNKQDFINAIYQDIEIVRGDSLNFAFELRGLQGVTPAITFTCKDHYEGDIKFIATNESGITLDDYDEVTDTATYSVRVAPEQTFNLDLTRYYYDLEASVDDDVITLMRGRLTLVYDVTRG